LGAIGSPEGGSRPGGAPTEAAGQARLYNGNNDPFDCERPVMNANTRSTSALAVISLVFGILGWLPVPVFGSIVAIVTGHLARAEIRRDPQGTEGDGMAVAGLVLGYSALAVCVLAIAFVFLFLGGMVWLGGLDWH
jgi:hypothetical protein